MADSTPVPVVLWCGSQLVANGLLVGPGPQEGGSLELQDVPAVYSGMVCQAMHYFEAAQAAMHNTQSNQRIRLVQEVAERYRSVLEQAASDYVQLAHTSREEEEQQAHSERAALAFQMRDVLNLVALVFLRSGRPNLAQPLFRKWMQLSEPFWRYSRPEYLNNWQENLPTDPSQRNEEIMWALEQLDMLLGTMPSLEDTDTFRKLNPLTQWQGKCQQAQQQAHQHGPRLSWLVFALLGGAETGRDPGKMAARVALDTIATEFKIEWQDYVAGYLSYVKPYTSFANLPSEVETIRPEADNDSESRYRQLIDAIMSGDAMETLHHLHLHFSCAWLSAHIADLLAASAHLNTMATPLLGGLDFRQHCLRQLACELMQFGSDMWQVVLCYLGHCGGPGAMHASAYIAGLQLPTDTDMARLWHYCGTHGLQDAARAACMSQAQTCVERGHYAQALLWLEKGGDTQQSEEVGRLVLRLCLGLGGVDAEQMKVLQDRVALAASQLQGTQPSVGLHLRAAGYAVAYHKAMAEGHMQEAWDILAHMLTNRACPMAYLHLLLFGDPHGQDAVGLFEGASGKAGRLSFKREDVAVVMSALEDLCASPHLRSFERTIDPSRVLRLRVALACALASATLAPAPA